MSNSNVIKIKDLKEKLDEIDKRYRTQRNQQEVLATQLAQIEQEILRILGECRAINNLIEQCEEKDG